MPHVMREMARLFGRTDQPMLAHYAFLIADSVTSVGLDGLSAEHDGSELGRYTAWAMRRSTMAQAQDLYRLGPYKAALAERLGPEGAGMVLAAAADPPGSSVARERPLRRLIDYVHEDGREFEEVIPAGPHLSQQPNILGRPRGWPARKMARSFFTCLIEDVMVSGKSDTLLTADVALLDIQDSDVTPERLVFSIDPIIAAGGPDGAAGGPDGVIVTEPTRPEDFRLSC